MCDIGNDQTIEMESSILEKHYENVKVEEKIEVNKVVVDVLL